MIFDEQPATPFQNGLGDFIGLLLNGAARLTDSLAPRSRRDYQTLLAGLVILRRVVAPIVGAEKEGCAESGRSVRQKEKK